MKFFSSVNLAFLQFSNSLIGAIEKEGLQTYIFFPIKLSFTFILNSNI
jgi:hypothetical protein